MGIDATNMQTRQVERVNYVTKEDFLHRLDRNWSLRYQGFIHSPLKLVELNENWLELQEVNEKYGTVTRLYKIRRPRDRSKEHYIRNALESAKKETFGVR